MSKGEIKPIDRSTAGLRDALIRMMEKLESGECDVQQAKAFAMLGLAVVKSCEVQLNFERLRLDSKIPAVLSDMKLVPPLGPAK